MLPKIVKYNFEIAVFFLLPIVLLVAVRLIGFDGLYGQDSYEYFRYSKSLKDFILSGNHPGKFTWPQGYPFITALLMLIFGEYNVLAQLVSVLSFSGTLFFTYKLIQKTSSDHRYKILYLLLSLLLSPYFARGAFCSMSDMLALFCLTACLYFAINYAQNQCFRYLLLAVLTGMYGMITRYAAAVPVFIIFLFLAYTWFRYLKWMHLVVLIFPLLFVGVFYYLNATNFNPFTHNALTTWKITNLFKTTTYQHDSKFTYPYPNLAYCLFPFYHPGFFFLNGVLVVYTVWKKLWQQKPFFLLIATIVLVYALFLGGNPYQNKRFLILTYPLVVVLLFPAFQILWNRLSKLKHYLAPVLAVIQFILIARAIRPVYTYSKLEKSIAQALKPYEGNTLYTFEIDIALMGRGVEFEYKNLWQQRYGSYEKGALALYNPTRFEKQWSKKNPMLNWNHLNDNYSLIPLKKMEGGWILYRIK